MTRGSSPAETVVWRLTDGKPGHEKQSAGLLQGLAELVPLRVHAFDVRDMRRKASFWRQARATRQRPRHAAPHLILGVGHATHLPLLAARAVCGGRCVVLMKPTLPHRLFDLVFVPQHDRCRPRANVVFTRGVVCAAVEPAKTPRSGLILLGGLSRHFAWPAEGVAEQVAAIAAASRDVDWQVCDSRRTPEGFSALLPPAPNLRYRHWRSTRSDFLERALATASYVWVTADSASMLYESLSAGASVGVIDLPPRNPRRDNKHARGVRALQEQGHVHASAAGPRLQERAAAPAFEPESRRCARIVVDRLLRPASGG